ncbi:hypothetical protein HanPI659440_Chr16g0625061 [Helianthus annuus]|nr:hypothetical protein HanPI659440_Chr16g0625061 [Helianthus annuus]
MLLYGDCCVMCWVFAADVNVKCVEDAIRCGGSAPTKTTCIKNMLRCLVEKRGELCLE